MESIFYALVLLACPVGMGAMMWFMVRGSRNRGEHRSLADLRAEQHRLDAEIERREREESRRLDEYATPGR
ncbi:MAG: hypothetical protein ACRDPC_05995 [Solirubrobacteraceae bacterium]